MFTSTDPSAWTPDDWASFDGALATTQGTASMVLAVLRDVANRVASSGRGAIGPLQELNLATVGLLRAAHTRMKVGEIILLEPQDWKHKRSPITTLKQMTQKNGREWTCDMVLNGLGWVVERVK